MDSYVKYTRVLFFYSGVNSNTTKVNKKILDYNKKIKEKHYCFNYLRIENAEGYVLIAVYLFIYLFIYLYVCYSHNKKSF